MENKLANPAPLGLLGFGMTTILLNLANAGIMPVTMVILAMGLALGGLAQVIAGVLEFKNGNTFGGTAFTAYGLFWWSLVLILTSPAKYAADSKGLGFYLLLWCVFTLFMAIGTLKHNHASQMVFWSLTLLFLLLSIHAFTGIDAVGTIAGIEGIICGLSAVYNAMGQVVNSEFGRTVLPLGDKN
ncbi:MAG: acetate uptake transporter [Coriobacteriia bacterium]|nr:acetate uptake transporter [Coriobacteriia bacterium]